jgi:hypothetical protein
MALKRFAGRLNASKGLQLIEIRVSTLNIEVAY